MQSIAPITIPCTPRGEIQSLTDQLCQVTVAKP